MLINADPPCLRRNDRQCYSDTNGRSEDQASGDKERPRRSDVYRVCRLRTQNLHQRGPKGVLQRSSSQNDRDSSTVWNSSDRLLLGSGRKNHGA